MSRETGDGRFSCRVSICIPAYNHGRFLRAALDSALAQTFGDVEIVVADNCSTDDTPEVVAEYVGRDPRVRYERATQHVDMSASFNRTLRFARGEYVKFLCADDVLDAGCVERLVAAMEKNNAILTTCARRFIDESTGRQVGEARYAREDWTGPGHVAAKRAFFYGNVIGEPTAVLFRRADAGEGFNARYTQLVDLDFWLRLLERGNFAFVAEPLCRIRLHAGQATRQSLASGRVSADKTRLFQDYAARPHMHGTLAERLLWDFRLAWSMRREPSMQARAAVEEALFFPSLWNLMCAGAALAAPFRRPA